MSVLETVERVRSFLERNGRVSYRMLRREFGLEEEALEELIEGSNPSGSSRPRPPGYARA